jgi:uncharacterized protein (TIGR02996 family)
MMDTQSALWLALQADSADDTAWLALADCLEEADVPARAELTRTWLALRRSPEERIRAQLERRLEHLLRAGVRPCVPALTNSLGMTLNLVPAGSFLMGMREGERGSSDEKPRHRVILTKDFYAGISPVTQSQYRRVIGGNPSGFAPTGLYSFLVSELDTSDFPVESVTWDDAVEFCRLLSELPAEMAAGRQYRLPTEAEWEYACRGAGVSTAPFCLGESMSSAWANFDGNFQVREEPGAYLERPTFVCSYPPNALGLFDVHGNVWEWCSDFFRDPYPTARAQTDPCGPTTGNMRSRRGGSWYNAGVHCRSAYRSMARPEEVVSQIGFRVVATLRQSLTD